MASSAVETAVLARLAAAWTASPIFGVNVQGQAPIDGSAFIKPTFPLSNRERLSFSDRYYRETGVVRILINVERGQGTTKAQSWADQLTTIFLDRKFDGVETQVPSPMVEAQDGPAGNYGSFAIACPYTFNFRG